MKTVEVIQKQERGWTALQDNYYYSFSFLLEEKVEG